jgi:DNA invertase Pin-like site-specific DNA recombinase
MFHRGEPLTETVETLQHLQRLSSNGVEWFSYREEYLRSIGPFKEAVLAILAAIAKQERIRLSERVQAGLKRARAQGEVLGRPRAAIRPERVRELHDRGSSIRQIASQTHVSAMTIQRILATQGIVSSKKSIRMSHKGSQQGAHSGGVRN